MTALTAALLGVVQGLTEFLPISSSAHLILARALVGWDADARFGLAFDVACHVGTLAAIVVYFRRELMAMVAALPGFFSPAAGAPARMARLIAVGTIPIVIVGLTFVDSIEHTLRTPAVALGALAAGAVVLVAAERLGARTRQEESLRPVEALLIGLAQAAALVPGVSRSGATIAMAVFLGLRRDAAARFGLLLGVPAILAAGAAEAIKLPATPLPDGGVASLLVGLVTSGLVGYFTIKYFIQYLGRHTLDVFAAYRLVVAGGGALWLALG